MGEDHLLKNQAKGESTDFCLPCRKRDPPRQEGRGDIIQQIRFPLSYSLMYVIGWLETSILYFTHTNTCCFKVSVAISSSGTRA